MGPTKILVKKCIGSALPLIAFLSVANAGLFSKEPPPFAKENYLGQPLKEYEANRGNVYPFRTQKCDAKTECQSFGQTEKIPGGAYAKTIWVRKGVISAVVSVTNVPPTFINTLPSVADQEGPSLSPPEYISMAGDGKNFSAYWTFPDGIAQLMAYCPGGIQNGKLVMKYFRQCKFGGISISKCSLSLWDDPTKCEVPAASRRHDAEW